DRAAVRDGLAHELVGPVDVGQRLLQVDDVDAVALGEDVALHLRVPAAGLVPEVHTGVQQMLHGDDGHGRCSPLGRRGRPAAARAVVRAPVGDTALVLAPATGPGRAGPGT